MTTQSDQAADSTLLTPEERTICEAISKTVSPHKQRAQLLLTVDSGVTQAEAGDTVGLSVGQTKYWLTRFRKLRLEAFPDDVLEAVEPEPVFGSTEDFSTESLQEEMPEPEPEVEQTAEDKEETALDEQPVKVKKQKKKKAKKAGKKKKGKKSKKDKKDKKKKDKKSKKGKKAKKKKKKK